jgi:hypothetical protein
MSKEKYKKLSSIKNSKSVRTEAQLKKREREAGYRERNRKACIEEFHRRGGRCEFCGLVDDYDVYEWHHIYDDDPTNHELGSIMGHSEEKVLAELRKTVLVCRNCHVKFHAGLCCMFEHKQQHIDGTFDEPIPEEDDEDDCIKIHESVFNPVIQEWEDARVEFIGRKGKKLYTMLEEVAAEENTTVDDIFSRSIKHAYEELVGEEE